LLSNVQLSTTDQNFIVLNPFSIKFPQTDMIAARILFSYLLCTTVYSLNMLDYYQAARNDGRRDLDDDKYYIKPK